MMKRVFAVLLALSLAAACVPAAFGEAEALSRNELNAWRDQLLKDSIADNRYASESMEDGAYSLTFDWYTLIADTQRLSRSFSAASGRSRPTQFGMTAPPPSLSQGTPR